MSFQYNQLKGKFKRLVIEFHHNKNKLGSKEHFIKVKDPTRPLLTLRTNQGDGEEEETPYKDESTVIEQNNEQFEGFTGCIDNEHAIEEEKEEAAVPQEGTYLTERRRRGSAIPDDNFKLSPGDLEDHLKRLEQSIGEINYIVRPPKGRKKYWLFGKRLEPQIIPDFPTTKVADEEEIENPSIEILVQSTESQGRLSESRATAEEDLIDVLSDEEEPLLNYEVKNSSFSRKNSRHNVSLITLTRSLSPKADQCPCAVCERKKQPAYQPWKVIMNDISLQAALLSTGSAVPKWDYSSGILQSDFTSSKHKPDHSFFSHGNEELVCLNSNDGNLDIGQIGLTNDENEVLESDLLDLPNVGTLKWNRSSRSIRIERSRPPTNHTSKTSIISELLGPETSLAYDDVFQAYDYSDDEKSTTKPTESETKPLEVNGGLRQIF